MLLKNGKMKIYAFFRVHNKELYIKIVSKKINTKIFILKVVHSIFQWPKKLVHS
jgi:hypothetical protein